MTRNDLARRVFTGLPRHYDRLGWLLSFGQDRRWRRAVVDQVVSAGPKRVLDVATGTAGIAIETARRCNAAVVAVDLNEPMLRVGISNVRTSGRAGDVTLVAARAERLPFEDDAFDAVSFGYLLRYVDSPAATLAEMARCLRPGGVMAGLEFYVPPSTAWRFAWRVYTAIGLPVLGLLVGGRPWRRVGRFLGPNIREHYDSYPLRWQVQAWERAGFRDVRWRVMSLGGGLVMWGTKGAAR